MKMKSPLRRFIKELIRGFRRQRIIWRNAFLLGFLITTIVVLLHTPTFPIFSDEETESSSLHLNIQIVSEAKIETFPTTPMVELKNSSVSVSNGKPVDNEETGPRKRRKRKKRKKTKDELVLPDPPPAPRHVLSSSEVIFFSFSCFLFAHFSWNLYNVFSLNSLQCRIEQRDALSLPPKEALSYAKLEIQHAPEVLNDTDLFAPVFRNLSVFKRYTYNATKTRARLI